MPRVSLWRMSKGDTFELSDACQRHLPLVEIRTVSRTRALFVLAAHIQSKILGGVVLLVAVSVVHKLTGRERPTKLLGHHPAVLENVPAFPSHGVEQVKFGVRNSVLPEFYVSIPGQRAAGRIALAPEGTSLREPQPAWPARAGESWVGGLLSQRAEGDPSLLVAKRAEHLCCEPDMAADSSWLHRTPVDRCALRERLEVLFSCLWHW